MGMVVGEDRGGLAVQLQLDGQAKLRSISEFILTSLALIVFSCCPCCAGES